MIYRPWKFPQMEILFALGQLRQWSEKQQQLPEMVQQMNLITGCWREPDDSSEHFGSYCNNFHFNYNFSSHSRSTTLSTRRKIIPKARFTATNLTDIRLDVWLRLGEFQEVQKDFAMEKKLFFINICMLFLLFLFWVDFLNSHSVKFTIAMCVTKGGAWGIIQYYQTQLLFELK